MIPYDGSKPSEVRPYYKEIYDLVTVICFGSLSHRFRDIDVIFMERFDLAFIVRFLEVLEFTSPGGSCVWRVGGPERDLPRDGAFCYVSLCWVYR